MYFFIIDGIGEFKNLVFIVKDLMLDIFFLIELLLLFKYNLLLLSLCKILLLFKVFLFFIFLSVFLLLLVFFLGNLVWFVIWFFLGDFFFKFILEVCVFCEFDVFWFFFFVLLLLINCDVIFLRLYGFLFNFWFIVLLFF